MTDATPADALKIGAGAGYAGDRIEPAVELARRPDLDYLVFECLAERTIALARLDMLAGEGAGYNPLLADRLRAVLPDCVENDIRVVTSMGAANPTGAADRARAIATALGYPGLEVASVAGSDVVDRFDALAPETFDGEPTADYADDAVAADAYLGIAGIVEALEAGADLIITGRVGDSSLFLAPMAHEFGWSLDPLDEPTVVGQGLVAAHLIECAGQVTGGYHADPGNVDVPDLAGLGFPVAEVTPGGEVAITKSPDTGGEITERSCTEQLCYEVHDPANYLTPDAVADFSGVSLERVGPDRVRVTGATAKPRPETLKVSIGYDAGVRGVGEISYAGPGAEERARLAGDVVRERLGRREVPVEDLRVDLVGVDALHGPLGADGDPYEVRLRVAAACRTEAAARAVAREVETLYTNGPAGGGGARMDVSRTVGVVSTLVDRDEVSPVVEVAPARETSEDAAGDVLDVTGVVDAR